MKLWTLFLTAFAMAACSAEDPSFDRMLDDLLEGTVAQISPEELAAEPTPVLLDSRSREEFEVSHLEGARWVGFEEFDLERVADLDRDTPLVVYCSVGKRSELIGERLEEAGFRSVRNLRGGLFQWANEGRPIVNDSGPVQKVHPYNQMWGRWLK